MFNYLEVAQSQLPISLPANFEAKFGDILSTPFQTKDLEPNFLESYRITPQNTLQKRKSEGYWTSKIKSKRGAGFIERLANLPRWVETSFKWNFARFTGEVSFYTHFHKKGVDHNSQKHTVGWIEFKAVFVRGKMEEIKLVSFKKPRKKSAAQLKKEKQIIQKWKREVKRIRGKSSKEKSL